VQHRRLRGLLRYEPPLLERLLRAVRRRLRVMAPSAQRGPGARARLAVGRALGARRPAGRLVALAAVVATTYPAHAVENCGQFGGFCRAQAAQQAIVLGVQQGISSLPPTSGQSFSWTYDPALDTYVRSQLLGPMSFRTPQTVGKGYLSTRLALSYFALGDSFGPITYELKRPLSVDSYAKFGTDVSAKVGLINIALDYGILEHLDVIVNVPLVIVDASAENRFSAEPGGSQVAVRASPEDLDAAFRSRGPDRLVLGRRPFDSSDAGFRFQSGTHFGVGRIDVGAKAQLYSAGGLELGAQLEFFAPSPSSDEFSGSDSPALLPRLIAQYGFGETQSAQLHVDVGYDYDFDFAELRRFVWNTGASFAIPGATFDAGFGGSLFDQGVEWTPTFATAVSGAGSGADTTLTALGDTRLGTNYVDFLFGVKVQVAENAVLGGTVNVPVTDDGLRAPAIGTIGFEYYFDL
jgi:hypothetical protein